MKAEISTLGTGAVFRQECGGAACGDNLDAMRDEAAGKFDQPGLVGDGNQCAYNFHLGANRTAWVGRSITAPWTGARNKTRAAKKSVDGRGKI